MTLHRQTIVDELGAMFDRATDGRVSGIKITEQMSLTDDLGLQSLDIMEVAFEIEKKWGCSIGDEEYAKLRSAEGLRVKELVDVVQEKVSATDAS